MKSDEFYTALEEAIGAEKGSMRTGVPLADIPLWDSMAKVEVMAMVDEKLRIILSASDLQGCKTTDDLYQLVATKLS